MEQQCVRHGATSEENKTVVTLLNTALPELVLLDFVEQLCQTKPSDFDRFKEGYFRNNETAAEPIRIRVLSKTNTIIPPLLAWLRGHREYLEAQSTNLSVKPVTIRVKKGSRALELVPQKTVKEVLTEYLRDKHFSDELRLYNRRPINTQDQMVHAIATDLNNQVYNKLYSGQYDAWGVEVEKIKQAIRGNASQKQMVADLLMPQAIQYVLTERLLNEIQRKPLNEVYLSIQAFQYTPEQAHEDLVQIANECMAFIHVNERLIQPNQKYQDLNKHLLRLTETSPLFVLEPPIKAVLHGSFDKAKFQQALSVQKFSERATAVAMRVALGIDQQNREHCTFVLAHLDTPQNMVFQQLAPQLVLKLVAEKLYQDRHQPVDIEQVGFSVKKRFGQLAKNTTLQGEINTLVQAQLERLFRHIEAKNWREVQQLVYPVEQPGEWADVVTELNRIYQAPASYFESSSGIANF